VLLDQREHDLPVSLKGRDRLGLIRAFHGFIFFLAFSDPDDSEDEVRQLTFGLSRFDRLLAVSHVVRGGAAFSLGNLSFLEPNAINTSGLIAH